MNLETRQSRASGGAWILEQLSLSNPNHERNAARRAMNEVVRAWPGDTNRLWWKWFGEAATNLGLRSNTLDCTVDEAAELALEGAQLVAYSENPSAQWLAVFGSRRRKFHMAIAGDAVHSQKVFTASPSKAIIPIRKRRRGALRLSSTTSGRDCFQQD